MAQAHKQHNNIDMYRKTMKRCSHAATSVLTKCMNGEIEDNKWNDMYGVIKKMLYYYFDR